MWSARFRLRCAEPRTASSPLSRHFDNSFVRNSDPELFWALILNVSVDCADPLCGFLQGVSFVVEATDDRLWLSVWRQKNRANRSSFIGNLQPVDSTESNGRIKCSLVGANSGDADALGKLCPLSLPPVSAAWHPWPLLIQRILREYLTVRFLLQTFG